MRLHLNPVDPVDPIIQSIATVRVRMKTQLPIEVIND
jgi:hypothetical protein